MSFLQLLDDSVDISYFALYACAAFWQFIEPISLNTLNQSVYAEYPSVFVSVCGRLGYEMCSMKILEYLNISLLVHFPIAAWNRLKAELLRWHEAFEALPLPSPTQ